MNSSGIAPAHVRRYQRLHRTTGHIWQGRFKACPIQEDEHLLTVLRYIERNPSRANLVGRAEEWPWSSLRLRLQPDLVPWLDPGPVPLDDGWLEYVNGPQTEEELARLRTSVNRGRPYGSPPWAAAAAARLGLESTLRPTGRPRQQARPEPGQDLLF